MDFNFNEDQRAIGDLAEQIISDRITDEFWRDFDHSQGYDQQLWQTLAEAGLLGMALPEDCGGLDMTMVELCMLLESQGKHVAPAPLIPALIGAALPLAAFASDSLKQQYLPGLISGEQLLTAAIADCSKTANQLSLKATQTANGWQLDGQLNALPYARQARAALIAANSEQGLVLAMVDLNNPTGTPPTANNPTASNPTAKNQAITLHEQQTTNHEPVAAVVFNGLQLASEQIISVGDDAQTHWNVIEQHVMTALGAVQLGVLQDALRRTAEYSNERKQFGTKIGVFQSVAHRAADAYIDIEAMRSTLWQAAWQLAQPGVDSHQLAMSVHCAKWWANEAGHAVSHTAQHLHGGIGSDIEFPIHRYFLWAKQLEMLAGNSRQQLQSLGSIIAQQPVGMTA